MGAGLRIHFLVDEHLPVDRVRLILEPHGHLVSPVLLASKDTAILTTAEEIGGIIITADSWFLQELFRFPVGHRNCYRVAGVVRVPGTWAAARLRLSMYLPIVELLTELRRSQPDRRVAIDLSSREIRIREP